MVCLGMLEAMGKMTSLSLRRDIPVDEIIDQIRTVRCFKAMRDNFQISCPRAMAEALTDALNESRNKPVDKPL